MKKEHGAKTENDQGSIQLEHFIKKKKEERKILEKLLKELTKEKENNHDNK
jgi:hypothetical protein